MNTQLANSLVQIIESLTAEERTLLFERLSSKQIAPDADLIAQISDRGLPSARISSTRCSKLVMKIQQILERQGIVHTDPEIMSGVPVFVGTRVPLQTFFDYLEGESGLAKFLEDFPHLKTPALQVLEAIAKVMLDQERKASAHSA
jgi:uncharacterized protein (DUF433 family)